jgi:hypothetical protein
MKSVPVLGHRQAEDLFLRLGRGEVSEEELVRITERLGALQLDSVSA